MLEPQDRLSYLRLLRPPEGYRLDKAIGTTFSLDLVALLIAPLSMALYESETSAEALKDPTALWEALRRLKGKMVVFCQKGRIKCPTGHNYLLNVLEDVVVEVAPPSRGRGDGLDPVFHPKIWALRFRGPEKAVRYRLLCLSRNLTFDRSWDTALQLEGDLAQERSRAFSKNRPLGDFLLALPGLAKGIDKDAAALVRSVADETLRVDFEPPADFEDYTFHPIGIDGYRQGPALTHDRLLIVSPFLSSGQLDPLEEGSHNALISRPETLADLGQARLKELKKTTEIYSLDELVEGDEPEAADSESSPTPAASPADESELSGLHAKVYVCDRGWYSHVFSGSANATEKGFGGGGNIEFLSELVGKRSKVGIDALIEQGESGTLTLRNLLKPFDETALPPKPDPDIKALESLVDRARQAICRADLRVEINPEGEGQYHMAIVAAGKASAALDLPAGVEATCRPLQTGLGHDKPVAPLAKGRPVEFAGLPPQSLGSFIVFSVAAKKAGKRMAASFVRNLPVSGLPDDRDARIFEQVVGDSGGFMRYLMFLLTEDPEQAYVEGRFGREGGTVPGGGDGSPLGDPTAPIIEEIVRAYSRRPKRLAHIRRAMADLRTSPQASIVPKDFETVWPVVEAALALDSDDES